jgi:hypothetical protein
MAEGEGGSRAAASPKQQGWTEHETEKIEVDVTVTDVSLSLFIGSE